MLKINTTFLLLFTLTLKIAYGQSANNNDYNKCLQQYIQQGNHFVNNADSLADVIKGLQQLNNQYNDNTSRVYIDQLRGDCEFLASNYLRAMQLEVLSLSEAKKWNITKPIPDIYALIGEIHKENANYPMAFAAAQDGLNAAIKYKDTGEIIQLLNEKAMFIRGYSLHFNKPIEKDSSLAIRMYALKIAESSPKYERLRVPLYDNVGQHYLLLKDYKGSIAVLQKAIPIAVKKGMNRSLTYNYGWLAQDYYRLGNKPLAAYYFNQVLALENMLKQPHRKMETYEDMSNCYASSGDYKNAFIYLQKYRWLTDSLKVKENEKQISELQIKYESAQKDKKLAILQLSNEEKSHQLTWLAIGSLLFLIFIVVLIYLYNIIRSKNKSLNANNLQINEQADKLQTLMQELHHRVKNNLQIVSSLLMLQSNRMEDNDEARNALDISRQRIEAMSIIHSSLYQQGNSNRVHLKEFVPILVNNVLESFGIKYEDMSINVDITVDDIDVDIAMPLGLIINEWVTNIFKHAYKNMKKRPALDILIHNNNGRLNLKIRDNGIGMPLALWEKPKGSFGVKLIKILVKQLSGRAQVSNVLGTTFDLEAPYLKII